MLGNEAERIPKQAGGRRSGDCDGKDDPHWGQRYIGGGCGLHFGVQWYPSTRKQNWFWDEWKGAPHGKSSC